MAEDRRAKYGAKRDEKARAEGWSSFGQKYRASLVGIKDPAEWERRKNEPSPSADVDTSPRPVAVVDVEMLGDSARYERVAIELLHDADDNVRRVVQLDDEFVSSVQSVGILQPVVVEQLGDGSGYRIVMGHRRVAAARVLGFETVPCVVQVELPTDARIEAMLVENLHREGLDPFDEAFGYHLLAELGHTQRDIADRVGKGQPHVSRRLKLLDLDDTLVPFVRSGALPLRHAESLIAAGESHQRAAIEQLDGIDPDDVERGELDDQWVDAIAAFVERQALLAEGAESGLPEWDGDWWELEECARSTATHWSIDPTSRVHARLVFGRERVAAPRPTPPTRLPASSKPTTDPSSQDPDDDSRPEPQTQAAIVADRAAWRARLHERADERIAHAMAAPAAFDVVVVEVLALARFDLIDFARDHVKALELLGETDIDDVIVGYVAHPGLIAACRPDDTSPPIDRLHRAFVVAAIERVARTISREVIPLDVARYMEALAEHGLELTSEEQSVARHWQTERAR